MKASIEWMARNPVAANILLFIVVGGGLFMAPRITQEVFPDIAMDVIAVSVIYTGAGPSEIEETLCKPMEESVVELEGIEEMTCTASEGSAALVLNLEDGTDLQKTLQDVRNAIDTIDNFPEDITTPVVTNQIRRRSVLEVVLSGEVSEEVLFDIADQLEEEFKTIKGVNYISTSGVRPKEILIEVQPEALDQFGITLPQLAQTISNTSLDLPAGSLKLAQSQVLLRTKSKKDQAEEFAKIPILTSPEGGTIYLGDIATIKETLKEADNFARFNGKPAVMLNLYQSLKFKPGEVSQSIREMIDKQNLALPEKVHLEVWNDRSEIFQDRFNLLIRNAAFGLILVFFSLSVFLEMRLAFWVMMGIPISFFGSLLLLPATSVSLNMISLFAFILVLGIVVDDAIVIGENIFQHREMGKSFTQAAIDGCMEMAAPVTFAILTTLCAFGPLLYIEGDMGKFLYAIPVIVIAVLSISLLEGLFILPAHLAHSSSKPLPGPFIVFRWVRTHFAKTLHWITHSPYYRTLDLALRHRYSTAAIAIVSLMISFGLIGGGIVPVQFFPRIESDKVTATIELPSGFPSEKAAVIADKVRRTAIQLLENVDKKKDNGRESLENTYISVQKQASRSTGNTTTASVTILLTDETTRNINTFAFTRLWRKTIRPVPEVEKISFQSRGFHFGEDIDLSFSHDDTELLRKIVEDTKKHLASFNGMRDIDDSEKEGNREFQFSLSEEAKSLGITPALFASNLRAAFQGVEALTVTKNRQEIEVNVLFPKEDRENLNSLSKTKMIAPQGGQITIGDASHIFEAIEPTSIRRINRRRVIEVTANLEEGSGSVDDIIATLESGYLKTLQERYPELIIKREGSQGDREKGLNSLFAGFGVAHLLIYALLAIFFKSYAQPLLVMTAIPFGIAGAVGGHYLLGHPLSFLSLFGLVGLTGVVVNDALILIDAVNRHPLLKENIVRAIIEASQSRLRPIILTSVTTFVGLMPMLAETSRQAKFLIPMAISLGMGIMFATFITLVLVPCFYLILNDFKKVVPASSKEEFVETPITEHA